MIFVSDFYRVFSGKIEIVECFPLIVFKGYAIKKRRIWNTILNKNNFGVSKWIKRSFVSLVLPASNDYKEKLWSL